MAFTPPAYFNTIRWGQREGADQTDPDAPLAEIRPGELDAETTARLRAFYQFANTTSWPLLLGMLGEAQAYQEAALGSVDRARYLSTAEGTVLDEIGALVGRPRQGLVDDALYVLAIRAEAGTIFSSGTIPEIVELTYSMLGAGVHVSESFPGAIMISAEDIAVDVFLVLLDVLADVPAAGVAAILESWDSAATGGWGSTTDPTDTEIPEAGEWSSTTGADADAGLALWSTGQPIGGE